MRVYRTFGPLFSFQASGNKVSRSSVLCGSQNIVINGKVSTCMKLISIMRKSAFCICENKGADQLRGNRAADQRLCFATQYNPSTA